MKSLLLTIILILMTPGVMAAHAAKKQLIAIQGNKTITQNTTYQNVILNLNQGAFTVDNNASLTVENSVIYLKISPSNPHYVFLKKGNLNLKNNIFRITVVDLPQTPNAQSFYYLIRVQQGHVDIQHNNFKVNQFYTLGLLVTNDSIDTYHFIINHNKIENFHGGVYLVKSHDANVSHNTFLHVSFGNILSIDNRNKITNNVFLMPGNNYLGDAIDVVDANTALVRDNFIANDSCYGMQILGSKNVTIDHNYIINGITHGIIISPLTSNTKLYNIPLNNLFKHFGKYHQNKNNENIIVTNNYLSQNRFAMTVDSINGFFVKNNIFIQKFEDAETRKFWTDNNNLFKNIHQFVWENNQYKEAFTQSIDSDNTLALKMITFPMYGGVVY